MKKVLAIFLIILMLTALTACGEKRTLHCDYCGGEVLVDADSNMDEEWVIYCGPCNEALFGEEGLIPAE